MPSPLETLVKILKLEREQGYKNTAVIGGLAAYGQNWKLGAHQQARKPEHHLLVDELVELMQEYEALDAKNDRHTSVTYMMDRIMGRVEPPPEYRLDELDEESPPEAYSEEYEEYAVTQDPPDEVEIAPTSSGEAATVGDRDGRASEKDTSEKDTLERELEREDEDDVDPDADLEKKPRLLGRPPEEPPKQRVSFFRQQKDSREDDAEGEGDWFVSGPISQRSEPDLPMRSALKRPPRKPRPKTAGNEAADIMRGLNADVTTVKGVGPRMAESLNRLGIETINDLLFFLPRHYDDYTQLTYIRRLQPEQKVTVIGSVSFTEVRVGRKGTKYFYMELDDGSGVMSVTFFGQPFLARQIRKGKQLVLRGKTSVYQGRIQMTNPEWEQLESESLNAAEIVPVYPLTEGLGARGMRKLMRRTVEYWSGRLPDYVPEATLERAELADLGWSVKNLHFPESQDHLEHARKRFIFDQLLLLQMAILANRREWQSTPAQRIPVNDGFLEAFISGVFPYELTRAQRRAIEDIRRDINTELPMNRLLQGDVGSGKTAVATTALAMAFNAGKQSAMMAPTSILAEQHYRGLIRIFDQMPESLVKEHKPVIALLTGSLTTTERESIYRGLEDGSIDIVVGTHALIQGGVNFKDLALAVIDEQHRFGVEQRGTLRNKGNNPHLLVMTATPIPRTLALTLHADLDLSIMDEKPPGREPVQTRIVEPVERERIYGFIEHELQKGRQAFIVHPLVEASESIDAASAVEAFERLSKVFFRYRVGLLHGRMRPAEKDDIMASFSNHEFDVMVTTSVAEVGVDIPNASVIVIEGANRFGLAQLHQFRGRVGRGEHASYCLLIPDSDSPEAMERLRAMEDTDDGFKLAEIDWKLRGPGDLVGTRQSGKGTLQLMEAMTPQLVDLAQREARTIYEDDPALERDEHQLLRQRVDMLYNEESDVS